MIKTLNLAIIVALGLGLNGCAVKQTDSTGTKVLKHTVNAPAYVFVGAGALGVAATELAAAVIMAPVALTIGKARETAKNKEKDEIAEEVSATADEQLNTEDEIQTEITEN